MALQLPLWQKNVINVKDGGFKNVSDLAKVHADIFLEITGSKGIKTLREFVSSWEEKNTKSI